MSPELYEPEPFPPVTASPSQDNPSISPCLVVSVQPCSTSASHAARPRSAWTPWTQTLKRRTWPPCESLPAVRLERRSPAAPSSAPPSVQPPAHRPAAAALRNTTTTTSRAPAHLPEEAAVLVAAAVPGTTIGWWSACWQQVPSGTLERVRRTECRICSGLY